VYFIVKPCALREKNPGSDDTDRTLFATSNSSHFPYLLRLATRQNHTLALTAATPGRATQGSEQANGPSPNLVFCLAKLVLRQVLMIAAVNRKKWPKSSAL